MSFIWCDLISFEGLLLKHKVLKDNCGNKKDLTDGYVESHYMGLTTYKNASRMHVEGCRTR